MLRIAKVSVRLRGCPGNPRMHLPTSLLRPYSRRTPNNPKDSDDIDKTLSEVREDLKEWSNQLKKRMQGLFSSLKKPSVTAEGDPAPSTLNFSDARQFWESLQKTRRYRQFREFMHRNYFHVFGLLVMFVSLFLFFRERRHEARKVTHNVG